mgnify:CR=1 FL=1
MPEQTEGHTWSFPVRRDAIANRAVPRHALLELSRAPGCHGGAPVSSRGDESRGLFARRRLLQSNCGYSRECGKMPVAVPVSGFCEHRVRHPARQASNKQTRPARHTKKRGQVSDLPLPATHHKDRSGDLSPQTVIDERGSPAILSTPGEPEPSPVSLSTGEREPQPVVVTGSC